MEITLNARRYVGELVIKDGNTTLEVDVVRNGEADWEVIEQLIGVAVEMYEYNDRDRRDFVMHFVRNYMTSDDIERLLDSLSEEYGNSLKG